MRESVARAALREAPVLRRALQLGREVRALARQGQLIASGRTRPPPDATGERVVVFVHGFMASGPVFDPMRTHVERQLGVATLDVSYRPFEPFERVAERLAETIERAGGNRRVDLVGHSLGGIVARWYLQELGGAPRIDRLVTLASPHAGTRVAQLSFGSLALAIRPGSPVIERLRAGRANASSVAHTAVVAGADRMVTPPESAAAIEDAVVHWIDGLGHNETLFDARVFDHVVVGLTR